MAVHPAEVLIFLNTFAGNVLSADIVLAAATIVVGHYPDHLATVRLDLEVWSYLGVVRQLAIDGVIGLTYRDIFLESVILPHRDRALDKLAHRRPRHLIHIVGPVHLAADVKARHIPTLHLFARVEADVAFRETVVRMRGVRAAVGWVRNAEPGFVGKDLQFRRYGLEDQRRLTAAVVAEPLLSEVPEQDGDRVVALLEERCDVNLVVIGSVRERSTLEPTLEDSEFAIDPHPVL